LGLTATEPLYVLGIDSGRNAVTVGPRTALAAAGLVTGAVNWLLPDAPRAPLRAEVKIRSQHAPAAATLAPLAGARLRVGSAAPQPAAAPGQLASLYSGDRPLCGAFIERAEAASKIAPPVFEAASVAAT